MPSSVSWPHAMALPTLCSVSCSATARVQGSGPGGCGVCVRFRSDFGAVPREPNMASLMNVWLEPYRDL